MELDLGTLLGARRSARLDFGRHAAAELGSSTDIIYFVPELHSILLAPPEKSWLSVTELLKTALLERRLQCISTATEEENHRVQEKHPWLTRCFTEILAAPPTEEQAVQILSAAKQGFERHHSVSYTDEAIRLAVIYSNVYATSRALPDKALDLMDEAGSYVRSQSSTLPGEVIEARRNIRFIVKRMDHAIANHEFEKARFFSDEERKARDELRDLENSLGLGTGAVKKVGRDAVEAVVASWTGLPVSTIRARGDDLGEESKA